MIWDTVLTSIRFLTSVDPHVSLKVDILVECFLAVLTIM